jgi:hypothetical protein
MFIWRLPAFGAPRGRGGKSAPCDWNQTALLKDHLFFNRLFLLHPSMLTLNRLVVHMARDVMILRRANPFWRPLEGVGPKKSVLFLALKWQRAKLVTFGMCWKNMRIGYAQHKCKNSKFEKVPSKHAEHEHKELMRALSICVRNWWARSSCASGIKWCLAPLKLKQQVYILAPKSSTLKGFMM